MPPASETHFDPTDHLLTAGKKSTPVGPTAGVVIVLVLLIAAAFYFWGAHLNQRNNPENNLPLIPGTPSDGSAPAGE